jgi:hypothetical protein
VGVIVLLELSGDRLEVLGVGWSGKCQQRDNTRCLLTAWPAGGEALSSSRS